METAAAAMAAAMAAAQEQRGGEEGSDAGRPDAGWDLKEAFIPKCYFYANERAGIRQRLETVTSCHGDRNLISSESSGA